MTIVWGAAEWTKILDRLNGKIYLIVGNHDLKNMRQGYVNRFEHVAMQMHLEVNKRRIYLNHYPFLCFDGGHHFFDGYFFTLYDNCISSINT